MKRESYPNIILDLLAKNPIAKRELTFYVPVTLAVGFAIGAIGKTFYDSSQKIAETDHVKEYIQDEQGDVLDLTIDTDRNLVSFTPARFDQQLQKCLGQYTIKDTPGHENTVSAQIQCIPLTASDIARINPK